MADFIIEPSQLAGELHIPPSKSHTLRAILFASLAKGRSLIEQYIDSPDTNAMIEAVRLLGAKVTVLQNVLEIEGVNGKPKLPEDVIQCGNSGIVFRFIGAIAGLIPGYTVITGDHSIRYNRPIKPLLNALNELGAFATSTRGNDFAPVIMKGPIVNNKAHLDGTDSQPVSALLIAAAFAPHAIELFITNPGETPWIDLTLHWLQKFHIPVIAKNYSYYQLSGNAQIEGFHYKVPGDFSTAAFAIAAAIITQSPLTLHNLNFEDPQGDKVIIALLQKMGANIKIDDQKIFIGKGHSLMGTKIDVNGFIDALPILAVIACFAKGRTEIINGKSARHKESDRIYAIVRELKKMGAQIQETPEGILVEPSSLHGAELDSHNDHRIALSLSIAALAAKKPSLIRRVDCIEKTYRHFASDFRKIGAKIQ